MHGPPRTSGVERSASQGVGELGREVIDKHDLRKAEIVDDARTNGKGGALGRRP